MGVIRHFKEFLGYLRRPVINYEKDEPLSQLMVIKLFFLVFAIEMILFIPISTLLDIGSLPHAMEDIMEKFRWFEVLLLTVVFAPFTEEFLFRFHLKYRPLIFLFFLVTLTSFNFIIVGEPIDIDMHAALHDPSLIYEPFKRYLPYVGLMILIYILYFVTKKPRNGIDKLITEEYGFVFYLTAVVFALIHLSNFKLGSTPFYFAPLLVLPQFILALYLGYVRVRNNIFTSITVHMINNAIPMLMLTLATLSSK